MGTDISLCQGLSNLKTSESFGLFVQTQNFRFDRVEARLIICISKKFPRDSDAIGQRPIALAKK